MEILRQQMSEVRETCEEVYQAMLSNPTSWAPFLPYSSPEQLNEVMMTIDALLMPIKEPKGFKPTFHLAKGLAATSLVALTGATKSLQKGEHTFFPAFIALLNQMLSSLHSMIIFSVGSAENISASLSSQLSESFEITAGLTGFPELVRVTIHIEIWHPVTGE
ncbi:MAG: hypothetical protein JWQ71_2594 [Pedosphaera sp.]|nr:hypothetical protein [Pedosphaera sp.]